MLHRVLREADGSVSAYRIETLKRRPDEITTKVLTGIMGCILPPMELGATLMVEQAVLCLTHEAIQIRTISSRLEDLTIALEDVGLIGVPGMVLRGRTPKDGMKAYPYRPSEAKDPPDLIREFLTECPKIAFKYAREASAERPWEIVPMVTVPVDPDRRSRLSAQAANYAYVNGTDLRFAQSTATLALTGSTWFLMALTPLIIHPTMAGHDWEPGVLERALPRKEN